jgi:transcriptional regulator with GAF, ATPase, and Fis domain
MSAKQQSIIGNSASLKAAMASARKVAKTDLSVLITGESGTGKELFARLVHDHSPRAKKTFVPVNCAAIPGELLEAELFGHKKGAFSGAVCDRDGLFMQANGGTLFLDEIGDMPLTLQAKILRVLQEGEIRPVGARIVQKVDVRIISATHKDLVEMVQERKFREDLIFRLQGYKLELPPLRERKRDVVTLARAILKSHKKFAGKGFNRDVLELLMSYSWPGNIRELQNTILAAAVDAPRNIGMVHLRQHLKKKADLPKAPGTPLPERILYAMNDSGRMTLAQLHAYLQVPKPTLHRYLKRMMTEKKILRSEVGGLVLYSIEKETTGRTNGQLTPRQEKAITHVKSNGRITRQEFAQMMNISTSTASRDLTQLVKKGILMPDGNQGRMAGYKAIEQQ